MKNNEIREILSMSIEEVPSSDFNDKVIKGVELRIKAKRISFFEDDLVLVILSILSAFILAFIYMKKMINITVSGEVFINSQTINLVFLVIFGLFVFIISLNKINKKQVDTMFSKLNN